MPNLKGTKTHHNLKDAFAGESQANRRYLYFAKVADVEGYPEVASNFRETAEGETGHAHGHLDYIKQVGDPATDLPIGDSVLNLKAAIAGENDSAVQTKFVLLGRKSIAAAHRFGWSIAESFESLHESPGQWPIDAAMRVATRAFLESDSTEVVLYYTKFISAMSQRVAREVVLPFTFTDTPKEALTAAQTAQFGGFKYGMPPEQIVKRIIPLLIKTQLTQAALEAKASEHAARMTAMDSATSNADDLISKLRLYYNRARQGAITKELLDIVGGAEALK